MCYCSPNCSYSNSVILFVHWSIECVTFIRFQQCKIKGLNKGEYHFLCYECNISFIFVIFSPVMLKGLLTGPGTHIMKL